MAIEYIILLTLIQFQSSSLRACTPNSQFVSNGNFCYCDAAGQANCDRIMSRESCSQGEIIQRGCIRCICQQYSQLVCINDGCEKNVERVQSFTNVNFSCIPFSSYYINCIRCVCPITGRFSDAQCINDTACYLKQKPTTFQKIQKEKTCEPRVIYLFKCLSCICSDDGFLDRNMCVQTCKDPRKDQYNQQSCEPNKVYKKDCNVCLCSSTGVIDEKMCTKDNCSTKHFHRLGDIVSTSVTCRANYFMKRRCIYCSCGANGTLDHESCLEFDCTNEYKYDNLTKFCHEGGMLPFCMECLCLATGQSDAKYCSQTCSGNNKLVILEQIVKDNENDIQLINVDTINKEKDSFPCNSDSIYIYKERLCVCPVDGYHKINFCASRKIKTNKPMSTNTNATISNDKDFNYTAPCTPFTFVEFNCNSCFCTKNGIIDRSWCTFDDCEAKNAKRKSHLNPYNNNTEICSPGSVSKDDCNYCLCPDNGFTKDRVCTKVDCRKAPTGLSKNNTLVCEPLAYYEIDCNLCLCPQNGIKNVFKCTKNNCGKSIFSKDECTPGEFFCDKCNTCICPPNGKKSYKVCTKFICQITFSWESLRG